ncbi:hypothetical protein DL96DRAFT_1274137 [Flagelloscypha sp. PMI_526]|nr:hypothetical protein DL96DRAFT_1274137 [Flagelloscypha sp. PMI_526]
MTTPAPASPARHRAHYSDSRFLVLQVEDSLFRIKSKHLTEYSQPFADMLAIPPPREGPIEGESDAHPIILEQETASTFSRTLDWLRMARKNQQSSFSATPEEWKSLFFFSRKWQIDNLHQAAKEKLRTHGQWDPIEMIRFSVENDLDLSWASFAVRRLCSEKRQPITVIESRAMSPDLFAVICYVKDQMRARHSCYNMQYGNTCSCDWASSGCSDGDIVGWIQTALNGAENVSLVL